MLHRWTRKPSFIFSSSLGCGYCVGATMTYTIWGFDHTLHFFKPEDLVELMNATVKGK